MRDGNLTHSTRNGRRVRFWKDIWCRDVSLDTTFPPCLLFLHQRRLGWQRFETVLEGLFGIPTFLGGSMIRRCPMWSIFPKDSKKEEHVEI